MTLTGAIHGPDRPTSCAIEPEDGRCLLMDMKLKAVVLPVSDVDRAKNFYKRAGFREDFDYTSGEDFRVVRFKPPG